MKKGFTLIELLIVVAIIAILAAIAIPNFLEAQTRAKVARVKADQRSIAVGIEAYVVDDNKYPAAVQFAGNSNRVIFGGLPAGSITTPVAYLTLLPNDPFNTFLSATATGPTPFAFDKAGFGFDGAGNYPLGPFTEKTTATTPADGKGFVIQLPSDYASGLSANGPVNFSTRDVNLSPLRYALWSIGPKNALPDARPGDTGGRSRFVVDGRYDATNGTISGGYVLRYGAGQVF